MAKKEKTEGEGGGGGEVVNLPNGAEVLSFLERVEALEAEKASARGSYMQQCKAINESKDEVFDEAKTKGHNKKALKTHLKKRKLERDLDNVAADLDGAAADGFAGMDAALDKLKEAA